MLQEQQKQNELNGIANIREVRAGAAADNLLSYLTGSNNYCAECNGSTVSWISLSLGKYGDVGLEWKMIYCM